MTTMHGWTVYSSTSLERHIDYLMMAIAEATAIAIHNSFLHLFPPFLLLHPNTNTEQIWYECMSVLVQYILYNVLLVVRRRRTLRMC